jgi:CheY-like chemotaxis protein
VVIDDPLAEDAAPVAILLVEDDPGDVLMTKEALADAKMANELHVVSNGEEALEFLFQQGQYAGAPRPGIILLDLNLPGWTGGRCWPRSRTTSCSAGFRWWC